MGQKTHPIGFRLGVIKTWNSRWFARRGFGDLVVEDKRIRDYIKGKLYQAGISAIEIERAANKVKLRIHTARPGIVIGKKGAEIENLRSELEKLVKREVLIDIQEIRKPEVDAQLVAENVAQQLVRRVAFRRAMKKAVNLALKFGAQGIKIHCAGRLGGAEMARREWY
ncbi:MAG: 30S ribosomal protein S3, partial [Thermodesulfobacteriota bacterium]